MAHAGLVAVELLRSFPRPAMLWQLAGRTWGCCQVGSYARHHARSEQLGQPSNVARLSSPAGRSAARGAVDCANRPRRALALADVRLKNRGALDDH